MEKEIELNTPKEEAFDLSDREDSDSENQNQYDGNLLKNMQIKTVQIKDPHQYLKLARNHKKFKIMDECNPILSNVYLKDISLQYKGPMQDKKYSSSDLFYQNIRRGNTLCQIYNQNQEEADLFFCRRGMKKFFDLQPQYLETNKHMTHQHQLYRKRIFEKIDKFQPGSKIHLYSIFKQNGEHCQITYIKKLDYWLIGSKNVSILVRSEQDLQKYYQKQRFYWAKLIAKEFLSVLSTISQQLKNSLKQELDKKTLLGQHCGNTQHQHITKYDKVQIIYYCIVEKTGSDHCLPVDYCKKFLNQYGFKMSKIKEIKHIQDKNQVYKSMYQLLKQTAQGTMQEYGEGNVLYVVQEKNQVQRTISMCKLKTSEYLIFRRMRQMLKLNVAKKGMTANSYQKFKFDIQKMVQKYFKPPKQLVFYFQMAKQAFKEAHKDKDITETYLRYKFVQFMQRFLNQKNKQEDNLQLGKLVYKKFLIVCLPRLTNTIQKYAKGNHLNIEYMYRAQIQKNNQTQKPLQKSTVHILYTIPRLGDYNGKNTQIIIYRYNQSQVNKVIQQIQAFKDLSKSHLITFVKSQDKRKNIQMLRDKIKQFESTLIKKEIKYWTVGQKQSDKDIKCIEIIEKCSRQKRLISQNKQVQDQEQILSVKKQKIFVIFPFILPGGGKSTLNIQLIKLSNQGNFEYISIQSDLLRRQVMQGFANQKNVQIDLDDYAESGELFYKSKQKTLQLYHQKLQQSFFMKTQKTKLMFLDKVFAPSILSRQFKRIQDLLAPSQQLFPIILLPNSQPLNFKSYSLPFSLRYILICLKRCLQREGHQTLTTRPHRIANVLLSYVQFYRNFNQSKLENIVTKITKQYKVIKINSIVQKDNVVSISFKNKIQECLQVCQSQALKDSPCFVQIIELLYKNLDYVQDSSSDNQLTIGQETWKKLKQIIEKHSQ